MTGERGLWAFATRFYGRPGIEAACLRLQDRRGLDVNLLLLASWLGRRHVVLGEERLESLATTVAPLRREVILPLRAVRRRMKEPVLPPPFAPRLDDLRQRVKGLELEGERLELQVLEALTDDLPPSATPVEGVIRDNLGLFGDPDRDPDLALLLAAATE